tara:strand:+ start:58 stop:606 length:549 start_codon:yes stop_codon:yes gene_type:complete
MVMNIEVSDNFNHFINFYLVHGLRGQKGIKSSQIAFFNIDRDNTLLEKIILNNKRELNNEIPDSLNRNIKAIYQYFISDHEELYLYDWIFLSIDEAIDIYKKYCSKGRTDVFDIAYRYVGMGHITMLACDLNTHLFFLRMDGGSNGWDREHNYNDLIENGSKPYTKINFTQWINNFSQNIYD